jgi:hypothetical protein
MSHPTRFLPPEPTCSPPARLPRLLTVLLLAALVWALATPGVLLASPGDPTDHDETTEHVDEVPHADAADAHADDHHADAALPAETDHADEAAHDEAAVVPHGHEEADAHAAEADAVAEDAHADAEDAHDEEDAHADAGDAHADAGDAHADEGDAHGEEEAHGHGAAAPEVEPATKQLVLGSFAGINLIVIAVAAVMRRQWAPRLPKHLQRQEEN